MVICQVAVLRAVLEECEKWGLTQGACRKHAGIRRQVLWDDLPWEVVLERVGFFGIFLPRTIMKFPKMLLDELFVLIRIN